MSFLYYFVLGENQKLVDGIEFLRFADSKKKTKCDLRVEHESIDKTLIRLTAVEIDHFHLCASFMPPPLAISASVRFNR